MRALVFKADTWSAYEKLREQDRNAHKALLRLIKVMLQRDPAVGTGKPEKLKHELSGLWSRRISKRDRLVYDFDDEYIYLLAIGSHYSQLKNK
jgi:toxin YoeB